MATPVGAAGSGAEQQERQAWPGPRAAGARRTCGHAGDGRRVAGAGHAAHDRGRGARTLRARNDRACHARDQQSPLDPGGDGARVRGGAAGEIRARRGVVHALPLPARRDGGAVGAGAGRDHRRRGAHGHAALRAGAGGSAGHGQGAQHGGVLRATGPGLRGRAHDRWSGSPLPARPTRPAPRSASIHRATGSSTSPRPARAWTTARGFWCRCTEV